MKYKVIHLKRGELRSDDTRYRFPDFGIADPEGLRKVHESHVNRDAQGPKRYGFNHEPPKAHWGYYVAQPVPESDVEVLTGEPAPKGSAAPLPAGIAKTPTPLGAVEGGLKPLGENPKARFGALKLPMHLVPPALGIAASRTLGDGVAKGYGAYNWRSTKVTASTYIGAFQRHLDAYRDGEDVDPESASGAGHLDALAANLAILLDAREHGTLVDDRSKGTAGKHIRRENDGYRRRAAPDPAGGPACDKDEDDLIGLLAEIRQAAWQVQSGEKPSTVMRPMTRRERRIAHSVVQGYPELTTRSYGDGDSRRVRIERVLGKKVR